MTHASNPNHIINLEVNCSNLVAINLYKKFDFVQVGLRKNYYDRQDGLLFTKSIICRRSDLVIVGDSPVVPKITRASILEESCLSICLSNCS